MVIYEIVIETVQRWIRLCLRRECLYLPQNKSPTNAWLCSPSSKRSSKMYLRVVEVAGEKDAKKLIE